MRGLRNLRHEMEERREIDELRVRRVTEGVTQWLIEHLPEDLRETMKAYVAQYGNDWWRKLDLDSGGVLGDEFRKYGYTENFMGQHDLKQEFKDLLARVLSS